jgi:hypothetical protein
LANPRGFGLRQSSAAFSPQGLTVQGGGLPQSKTLARHPVNTNYFYGYSIFKNAMVPGLRIVAGFKKSCMGRTPHGVPNNSQFIVSNDEG